MIFFSLSLIFDLGMIDPFLWPHRMWGPPPTSPFILNATEEHKRTEHAPREDSNGKLPTRCWAKIWSSAEAGTQNNPQNGAQSPAGTEHRGSQSEVGNSQRRSVRLEISPHSRCDDPLLGISWLGTRNGHPLGRVVEKQATHKLSQEAGTWHITCCPSYLNVSIYSTWIADRLFIMPCWVGLVWHVIVLEGLHTVYFFLFLLFCLYTMSFYAFLPLCHLFLKSLLSCFLSVYIQYRRAPMGGHLTSAPMKDLAQRVS